MKLSANALTSKVAAAIIYALATLGIIGAAVPALISARDSLLVVIAIGLLIAWLLGTVWLSVKIISNAWNANGKGIQE